MLNIGPQELLLVLLVALIVVGPKRLPEIGRSIGRGLRELRKVQDEVRDTIRFDLDQPEPRPVAPKPGVPKPVAPKPGERTASDGPEPGPAK